MDWYSWLSKTNLDPYLVYEYGRTFTHNELQRGDTSYFNHEFLQSMGVTVAKHRLEILKLAKNSIGGRGPRNGFSKMVSAFAKTRMLLSKKIGRCVSSKRMVHTPRPDPNPFRPQWPSSNLRKTMGFEENKEEKVKKMKSGPLDRKVQESYMSPKKVLSASGPLERKVQENMMLMYHSPMDTRPDPNGSGSLDVVGYSPRIGIPCSMMQTGGENDVVSSLWSLMFQDMKPT
uniref:uncharacterized protein LOC122602265 n=1 Tax=Erigeron canadensis TaxID=72917 RepID=UPI001CB9C2C3|nr:uncharacterized protein LOC122602265 [Erigeron canadensis]